jgi:hypothetical protein
MDPLSHAEDSLLTSQKKSVQSESIANGAVPRQ